MVWGVICGKWAKYLIEFKKTLKQTKKVRNKNFIVSPSSDLKTTSGTLVYDSKRKLKEANSFAR